MKQPFEPPTLLRSAMILLFSAMAAHGACSLEWIFPSLSVIAASLLLMSTAWMHRSPTFLWQVVARATWWQATVVGLLFVGTGVTEGAVLALGGIGAALAGGRHGLTNPSATFVPAMYAKTLTMSLVLAIADIVVLLIYAGRWAETMLAWADADGTATLLGPTLLLLGSAAAMLVAVRGLLRLKMWGLIACIAANLAVAALAISGAFGIQGFLAVGLAITAVAQLVLPLPLLRTIVRTQRLSA